MGIVADSSFYILFYKELEDPISLHMISGNYDFYIGKRLKSELRDYMRSDEIFRQTVIDVSDEVDFIRLLDDYYSVINGLHPGIGAWKNDGEFEVIGLSYILKQYNKLKYLIIDDKTPYNFVKRNLAHISPFLVRTIGFLHVAYKDDKSLDGQHVIDIYNCFLKSIENGKRPLNLTKNQWFKIVEPIIIEIKSDDNDR